MNPDLIAERSFHGRGTGYIVPRVALTEFDEEAIVQALAQHFLGLADILAGIPGTEHEQDRQPIAHRSAEQRRGRHPQPARDEIDARHLDRRLGVKIVLQRAVHGGQHHPQQRGIGADQRRREILVDDDLDRLDSLRPIMRDHRCFPEALIAVLVADPDED